ncbi:MAG: hypothetical protein AAGF20_00950, partial [Pseudomonadota bacterium]
MTHFYFAHCNGENCLFDGDTKSIEEIATYALTDEEYDELTVKAIEWDEDGNACEWDTITLTEQEWLSAIGGQKIIDRTVAVQTAARPDVNYTGAELDEDIALFKADPAYLIAIEQVTTLLAERGWDRTRFKNLSAYFEPSSQLAAEMGLKIGDHRPRLRVSNHDLGQDWSGRRQTGGASAD